MFELLITLSDNFGWDERGEVFDIGMRNISATKLREKTHFVFEVIMWKCFCSQNVLPCVCLNAKSENISILLQGSRTWCGGASPLVNPTADAIYKPPKPTLEVTCQTQSQTLGGRKWWLMEKLLIWLNTCELLDYAIPATATPPTTATTTLLKSRTLTHNPQANAPSAGQSPLWVSHTENEVKQAQSAQRATSFVEVP